MQITKTGITEADGRTRLDLGELPRYRDLHFMDFKSRRWRHDGTPAPWEALDRVCRATVDDMKNGIVIDASEIWPLPSTGP